MNVDDQVNTLLSADAVIGTLRSFLQTTWQATAREGFSVSRHDLDEIARLRARALPMLGEMLDCMLAQAEERRRNLERYGPIQFISLGEDCFSRTVLTQWGLRSVARLGAVSYPFDLAVHPLPAVLALLRDGFEAYPDARHLAYDAEYGFCVDRRLGIGFNHETGPEYAVDDFAMLKATCRRRVAHLERDAASGRPVAFVIHVHQPTERTPGLLDEVAAAARARWPDAPAVLCCVQTWAAPGAVPPDHLTPGGVVVINAAYPSEDYVWHDGRHCFTPAGFAFEYRVVERLKQAASPLLAPRA